MKYAVAETYSIIGGWRNGIEQTGGFDVVWAHETKNKYLQAIYQAHYPHTPYHAGELGADDARGLGGLDVITASFPCTSFSAAGRRDAFQGEDGRHFFAFCDFVEATKPRAVVFENVPGLLSVDCGRTFAEMLLHLEKLGYWCEWQILDSSNFGLPQRRRRLFVLGHARGARDFPAVFPFGSLDRQDIQECQKPEKAEIAIMCAGFDLSKKGGFSVDFSTPFVHTITAYPGFAFYNPETGGIRWPTPEEIERLQGLPSGWTACHVGGKAISDARRRKLLGKSVAPPVIKAIFEELKTAFEPPK